MTVIYCSGWSINLYFKLYVSPLSSSSGVNLTWKGYAALRYRSGAMRCLGRVSRRSRRPRHSPPRTPQPFHAPPAPPTRSLLREVPSPEPHINHLENAGLCTRKTTCLANLQALFHLNLYKCTYNFYTITFLKARNRFTVIICSRRQ